jgi:methoxymalonate biosynthesis acyl carrier protein
MSEEERMATGQKTDAAAVRDRIRDYIQELTRERVSDDSINLLESGILTSLDVMDVIAFLERDFSFVLADDDVDMESFGSVESLARLVERAS